MKFYCF